MKKILLQVYDSIHPNRDLALFLFIYKFFTAVILLLPLNILVSEAWGSSNLPARLFEGDFFMVIIETINSNNGGFSQYAVFLVMLCGLIFLLYQFLLAGIYGKLKERNSGKENSFNLFYYSGKHSFDFIKIEAVALTALILSLVAGIVMWIIFDALTVSQQADSAITIWLIAVGLLWYAVLSFFFDCCRAVAVSSGTNGLRSTLKTVRKLWSKSKFRVIGLTFALYGLSGIVSMLYLALENLLYSPGTIFIVIFAFLILRQLFSALRSFVRFLIISGSVAFIENNELKQGE
ncbi:MAG: hypothetical protein GF307_06655 [candidate division Zixibacteria bacterium]|nr:hypothetical protein [candidate division Zixibacteria bacterium]